MRCLTFFLALTYFVLHAGSSHSAEPKRPNFLIIYADDLGYGETGVQGCKDIPTPHIDSIAKNGLRCTQGYVAATYCSPSRAGLMTGKSIRSCGIEHSHRLENMNLRFASL